MTRVARLLAATLAVVLALFPLALERCRTACATPATQSAPSAHACHELASDERTVVATPVSRTCGHSDEARIADTVALTVSRPRLAIDAPAAVLTALVSSVALGRFTDSPAGGSAAFDRVVLPRHLPLRL